MHRFRRIAVSMAVLLCVCLPAAGQAIDIQSLTAQAQQAAAAGNNVRALGLYELALAQSVGQPEAVSGPLDGQYWQLIARSDDFPRALSFFTAFNAEQKTPSATLLASEANASGAYFGWLQQNQLMASLPPETIRQMDARARKKYSQALALDPDNFTALYGYAIYESYSPNGKAHMQQLLAKLNSLRSSHPQYPWQMVDYLETHGHPQQ